MRAKIAQRAKGHVFEDRFVKLNGLQLILAYRQAIKEETAEFEMWGEILKTGFERLEDNFKTLQIFTNPQLWAEIKKQEDLKVMQEEISTDNFDAIWADTMTFAPEVVTVEANIPDINNSSLPKLDKKTQDIITGFLPKKTHKPKEGGKA